MRIDASTPFLICEHCWLLNSIVSDTERQTMLKNMQAVALRYTRCADDGSNWSKFRAADTVAHGGDALAATSVCSCCASILRAAANAAQAALSSAPDAPTWSDAAEWQKWVDANQDGRGRACVTYAHRWARLMEAAMASGEPLAECASRTSHLADTEGITGAMYGAAVLMLSQCWIHGEDLRRWHNKGIAPGEAGDKANESGGVINPAILTIG